MDDESGEPDSEQVGVLGDGGLHAGKYNMALVRRAIRERWPITPEMRERLVNQMMSIADGSDDERNRIAAGKVVVAADSINAKREAAVVDDETGGVSVNVGIGIMPVDERRVRISAIAQRLRIGGVSGEPSSEEAAKSNGSTNGVSHAGRNGKGKSV